MDRKSIDEGNESKLFVKLRFEAGCRFYVGYPITPQSENT
jgi:pyruvate/2-oxoacid:ferredoxin oxidoreductase alpha subunit